MAESVLPPGATSTPASEGVSDATRRDFLYITTAALSAVGVGSVAWVMIDQMNPDAATLALASIDVDVGQLQPGQAITAKWRGKPVFLRRRTAEEMQQIAATEVSELRQPQTDAERTVPGHEDLLVVIGVCTHLGCVPLGQQPTDDRGLYGGWFCPCHGSHYDASGRIRQGPAERNLDVPPYQFTSESVVRIG